MWQIRWENARVVTERRALLITTLFPKKCTDAPISKSTLAKPNGRALFIFAGNAIAEYIAFMMR